MKKYIIMIFIFLSQIYCVPEAQNSGENKELTFLIWLDVTYSDKSLKNQVESYLSREFRSLGDVKLVEPLFDENDTLKVFKYDYYIEAITTEIKNVTGKIGYAMAFVISEPLFKNSPTVCEILKKHYEKEIEEYKGDDDNKSAFILISKFLLDNAINKNIYVITFIDVNSDLRELCDSVVTTFDSSYLKLKRERWKEKNNH